MGIREIGLFASFICLIVSSGLCISSLILSKVSSQKEVTNPKSEAEKINLDGNLNNIDNEYSIIRKGNHYFFTSRYSDAYLSFLDQLNLDIYEIVNIQITHFEDGNFFITYKSK